MRTTPCLDLCNNIKTGDFVIINYAENQFGFQTAAGKLVLLRADQMKAMGLDIVLTHLNDYASRMSDELNEINTFTSVQKRKFFKAHRVLDIWLENPSLLRIVAIQGFTGTTRTGQK